MAFTRPVTFVNGSAPDLNATNLNSLQDGLGAYAEAPTLKRTILNNSGGTQAVTSGAAAVKATWDVEREDTLAAWTSGAAGDIVIPEAGYYFVTICPAWLEQNSTGVRAYHLQVDPLGVSANAVMLSAMHNSPNIYNGCTPFSWAGTLAATDVLSLWVYHEAGTTLHWGGASRPLTSGGTSKNCEISVTKIGV